MAKLEYIPGVCNIGPVEIANRRQMGIISLVIAIALAAGLFGFNAPPLSRLVLFIPLAISSSAIIQAQLHFCAGFGAAGLFNFGTELGKTDTVSQADYRAKDKRKAVQITVLAVIIGAVLTTVAIFV
jgi:hypothetical protein